MSLMKNYVDEELDSEQVWVAGHISLLLHFFLYFFGFESSSGSTFHLTASFLFGRGKLFSVEHAICSFYPTQLSITSKSFS